MRHHVLIGEKFRVWPCVSFCVFYSCAVVISLVGSGTPTRVLLTSDLGASSAATVRSGTGAAGKRADGGTYSLSKALKPDLCVRAVLRNSRPPARSCRGADTDVESRPRLKITRVHVFVFSAQRQAPGRHANDTDTTQSSSGRRQRSLNL